MVISELTQQYELYAQKQSRQIGGDAGQILFQRTTLDGAKKESSVEHYNERYNTYEFRKDFAQVLSALNRDEGGFLLNSETECKEYLTEHPNGIMVETDAYTYLIKGNAESAEVDIYAYVGGYLDEHIKQAEKGIRFINTNYKELFRIPDGGKIVINYNDGSAPEEEVCRFIDNYHFQTENGGIYHISQFAEICEENNYTVEPYREKELITVLVVEPGKEPYKAQIEDTLQSYQKEVGGYIECVYPWEDTAAIICNEEGKLLNLPLNRALKTEEGEMYDIIAGRFMVVGLSEDNFCSLSEKQLETYTERFKNPEFFIRRNESIVPVEIKARSKSI
ncbi:MAG: DUF3846 domain-containing protein [Clostridia bacterium]|nr:DUF3846 domain-containing protein [Clostridia bacterium]